MRLSWAIVLGLAAGLGVGWLLLKKDAPPSTPSGPVSSAPGAPAAAGTGPRLYRWRDGSGVLHVSDVPPADRPFEEVNLRDDQNVVPMSGPAPEPSGAQDTATPGE